MNRFIANSFQVPNALVDEVMAEISGNALKCYMLITRKTTGWGKSSDKISISQFKSFCGKGMSDDRTVQSALAELGNLNLIKTVKASGVITEFSLRVNETEQPTNEVPTKNGSSSKDSVQLLTNNVGSTTPKKCWPTTDNNKNTLTKNKTSKKDLDLSGLIQQPSKQVWNDYLEHRKNKRAKLTQSALTILIKHINDCLAFGFTTDDILSECMARGWTGFKSDWLSKEKSSVKIQSTFITRSERNRAILEAC